ncbi:MAG: hypothetical protein K6E91_14670 [Butyrivibrio sp.]|nr:hypothetical protein [Butyrivibrio sp.]
MAIEKKNIEKKRESIFLNEHFMEGTCAFAVITGLISIVFFRIEWDYFSVFELVIKLVTTAAMLFAFKSYDWDVAKGLMGGVLFCIMYQEAYLVLARLWGEQDFDTYLVVGVQGSLYLAAAGMSLLLTIIIAINHFIINYASSGNPENVIFNRLAIIFKFAVYLLLLLTNSKLGLSSALIWKNGLQYLTDMAIFLLFVSIESQFDLFKVLRKELLREKRKRSKT